MSLFCNDKHIFCGQPNGVVRVYSISSGQLLRELLPQDSPMGPHAMNEMPSEDTLVAGGKTVVAAVTWGRFVTVWSSEGEMEQLASYKYRCRDHDKYILVEQCPETCECHDSGCIEDIKLTAEDRVVFVAVNLESASPCTLLVLKETEAIWRVDDAPFDQRCGFYMDAEQPALLSCNGDYFLYGECPRMSKWDMRLSFGTEAKNFEDWCGHPHNPDGMELDERDTTDVTCLLLEPPYLVMVSELDPQLYGKPYEPHSCLRVYNMESYQELKAFERSSGVCSNLESNKYVVVHLLNSCWSPETFSVVLYDKKTLLDPHKTTEEVLTQRIELPSTESSWGMSINTTSLVVNEKDGSDLRKLDFWVGNEELDVFSEERGQEPKKLKLN